MNTCLIGWENTSEVGGTNSKGEKEMYYHEIEEKYKNKMTYPLAPKKPFLLKGHTAKDAKEYVVLLENYEKALKNYKEELKAYNTHTSVLLNKFKKDALEDVGLADHPRADKAYSTAWEYGHSGGLYGVYQWLCELADLLL